MSFNGWESRIFRSDLCRTRVGQNNFCPLHPVATHGYFLRSTALVTSDLKSDVSWKARHFQHKVMLPPSLENKENTLKCVFTKGKHLSFFFLEKKKVFQSEILDCFSMDERRIKTHKSELVFFSNLKKRLVLI